MSVPDDGFRLSEDRTNPSRRKPAGKTFAEEVFVLQSRKIHYAWIICGCCTLLMFCTSGLSVSAFSVYTPYIVEHNGFTNVQVSMLTTLRNLCSVLAKLMVAVYYARIGLRRGITLAGLFSVAGFLLYALGSGKVWMYYTAASLTGFSNGLGAMIPVSILINRWFRSRRTLALSICASGTAVATFTCPTLATWAVENWGLSAAFGAEAALVLGCVVAISLLIRNDPGEKGLQIYDTGETAAAKQLINGVVPAPFFYCLMLIACFLVGGLTLAFPSYNTLYYREVGFEAGQIALVLTFGGVTLLLGKWIYGFANDLLGSYRSNFLFIGAIILGTLMGCMLTRERLVLLLLSNGLWTIGFALATVGISVWASNLSDGDSYVRTLRNFQLSYTIGGLAFSSLPGILAEITGSYYPTRVISVVMACGILVCVQSAYASVRRRN